MVLQVAALSAFWQYNFNNANIIDIGAATKASLSVSNEEKPDPEPMRNKSKEGKSQSNGGMMRTTPLAVYLSNIDDDSVLEKVVWEDVSLTHGDETVQQAVICYCIAIRSLIRGGDRKTAYEDVK